MTMAISAAYDTYTLISTNLDELFEHAQQQGESILQQTDLEVKVKLPKILGEGGDRIYCLPDLTEIEEWRAQEPTRVVMIYADPSYFQSFCWTDNILPDPLQNLIKAKSKSGFEGRFHQYLGKMTPAIKHALQQILHCPYRGGMQQLYLESKALELLTLQFAHWKANDSASEQLPSKKALLRSDDVERLHRARKILIENSAEPPSKTRPQRD